MQSHRFGVLTPLLLQFLLWLPASPASAEEMVDAIAAQVGGDIVLVSEVLALSAPMEAKLIEAGGGETDIALMREDLLDRLIERRIIEQVVRRAELEASEAEIDQAIQQIAGEHGLAPEQLVETVEAQGMSYDAYRQRIRGQIQQARVVQAMVTSRVRVEDKEIERLYYQRYADQPKGGDEARLRHILLTFGESVRPERVACGLVRRARARIAGGEPFELVAEEVSELNPERGGDLGWVHLDNLAGWMADELAGLEEGEITEVIKTDFGCNILQVVARRSFEHVSLEDARPSLYNELFSERTEEKFGEWMDELRAQTYIERKEALTRAAIRTSAAPVAAGPEQQEASESADRP